MLEKEYKDKKEELKHFFRRLGEVINETLNHSEDVQAVLNQIRGFGPGVDLSMVIGLGLYCHPEGTKNNLTPDPDNVGKIKFELTSADKLFLEHYGLRLIIDSEASSHIH